MISFLNQALSDLKILKIGPRAIIKLAKIGIKKVSDLLFYFPLRYEDLSNVKKISELKIGELATTQGRIIKINSKKIPFRKKLTLIECFIEDETGAIKIVWFNQIHILKILRPEMIIRVAGKLLQKKSSGAFMINPIYEIVQNDKKFIHTGRLIPIYPFSHKISSKFIRSLIAKILTQLPKREDSLPREIIMSQKLLNFNQAIKEIHFPSSRILCNQAKRRFAFENIFLTQFVFLKKKLFWQNYPSKIINFDTIAIKNFVEKLSFQLTNAQKKVIWQILQDFKKNHPMNRLLQGDVGSGKTIVALICALEIIRNKGQVAFMAPTEILASQHYESAVKLLKDYRIKIGLLTSSQAKVYPSKLELQNTKNTTRDNSLTSLGVKMSKNFILKKIEKGEIDLIIGTHSLIQKKVKFKNLAFIIIDEQHRFGVEQRAAIIRKIQKEVEESFTKKPSPYLYPKIKEKMTEFIPHFLSMSATPIPRSLALMLYGDLDFSILDEMPPGRKKIITKIIESEQRKEIYKFIEQEIKNGRQAFVICPRIESPSETDANQELNNNNAKSQSKRYQTQSWLDVKNVSEEYKMIKKIFPRFKIAMLHGKIKSTEKEKIMNDFAQNKINILIATSVVEVGIDIPNATIMMIESAEKFGLAQLHQLRGRVGRGEHQSYFLIMLSEKKPSFNRLKILTECEDGFKLAEMDLKFRGPGEFLGKKQSGMPDIAMQNLSNFKLIETARQESLKILKTDPDLKNYPILKEKVKEFEEKLYKE